MTGRDHPCCPEKEEGWVCTVVNRCRPLSNLSDGPLTALSVTTFQSLQPRSFSCHLFGGALLSSGVIGKPNAPLWQVQFHNPPPPPSPYFAGTLVCFCLKLFQLLQEIGSAGVEGQTAVASRRAISHFLHFLSRDVGCFAWRLPSCCFLTPVRLPSPPARRSTTSDLPRCLREKSVTSCLSHKYKYVATLHI